jgi:hypothetical protein
MEIDDAAFQKFDRAFREFSALSEAHYKRFLAPYDLPQRGVLQSDKFQSDFEDYQPKSDGQK